MATSKELLLRAQKIEHLAAAKLDEANTENRSEIHAEFGRMIAEADEHRANADMLSKIEARDSALNAAIDRRPSTEDRSADAGAAMNAEQAIDMYLRNGLMDMDAEQRGILRSFEARAGQSKTASEGGYTVPTTWADKITKGLKAIGPMLDGSAISYFSTSDGQTMNHPYMDDTAQKGRRIAEGATANATQAAFSSVALDVYKYTSDYIPVSSELLADTGYDLVSFLSGAITDRIGRIVNDELTTGTGSSMPQGIVTAVGTPSLQTANAAVVTANDLTNLELDVDAAYRANGAYMLSDTVYRQARLLLDTTGRPLWAPSIVEGAAPTINGKRFVVNTSMATATTSGTVTALFGDLKAYKVRQAGSFGIKRLNEIAALSDQTVFVAFARFGGVLVDGRAIKGIKFR